MRILWKLAVALAWLALGGALGGCYTVNQARLGNFVTDIVQPGMPMEQALVRMRVEDFYCSTSSSGTVAVCTRAQESVTKDCVERVDLVRSSSTINTVGAVDILEIKCTKKIKWL